MAPASRHFPPFAALLPSLEGRVVLVTGCTTGTGRVAAAACVRKGAHVVMLNRPSERADRAENEVREAASEKGNVTAVPCDLMDFASVRAAAKQIIDQFPEGVDVLVCNAGVMALADKATKDGYDVQMQTNHLSHFLLASALFPLLEKAAEAHGEARIVSHSSIARTGPKLEAQYFGPNGGNLGGDGASMLCGGARWVRYHQTKLANAVFTAELAARLEKRGSKVKATVAAPGFAATNLQTTTQADKGMNEGWIMRFSQSAEDGAMPLIHASVGEGVKNGDFFVPDGCFEIKGRVVKKAFERNVTDAASRALLWRESEKAVGAFAV